MILSRLWYKDAKVKVFHLNFNLKVNFVTWLTSSQVIRYIDLMNDNFSPKLFAPHFHPHACRVREKDATRCENVTILLYHHVIHHDTKHADKQQKNICFNREISTATFPRCENWQLWEIMLRLKLTKHTYILSSHEKRWDWLSKLVNCWNLIALKINPR